MNSQRAQLADPDSKTVAKINQAVTLMVQMIDEVRNLSIIESGKLNLKSTEVCPLQVLETIQFLFDEKLKAKNITLNTEIVKSDESYILGDQSVIVNQIVSNLLSNAIKFSYPNSIVSIRIEEIFDRMQISIKDTGTGIIKSSLNDVFDPNKSTSKIGTQGEKGTGYGLPLVKAFTEAMSGTIQVESLNIDESPQAHGSLFTISFPRVTRKSETKSAA